MAKFMVNYQFSGRASTQIEAPSMEAAKAKIAAEINRDDFELDADEIDDVDFSIYELHPVTRGDREIWTPFVKDGDIRGHQSALASTLFAAVS